ncbi:MAG: hypothetical protein N3G80_01100 [Candidatus Micrarchaeota archaeon]|nr:hypothetical protein [Candidatus Micrarchaeota archaeon]
MRDFNLPNKGFFFTVTALILLSFMLLTSQMWVRTFAQKDQHLSMRFKGESMRMVLSSISDKSLSQFANASAFFATFKMVNATQVNGLSESPSSDPRNPGTGAVEKLAYELMLYGNSSSPLPISYSAEEKEAYTIAGWQQKIRQAANIVGMNVSFGPVENFVFLQKDPWTVGVSFEMEMNLTDLENTMKQSKRLKANSSFSINGFVDPLIVREELNRRPGIARDPSLVAQKQIWKHVSYNSPSDVSPVLVEENGLEGSGWFFGPITSDYPDQGIFEGEELNRIKQYILVHRYDENISNYANFYGAVILTTSPRVVSRTYTEGGCNFTEYNQTDCLNCLRWVQVNSGGQSCRPIPPYIYKNEIEVPFIVAGSGWSANSSRIPIVKREGVGEHVFVLIDNEFGDKDKKRQGYHRIWDITKLRDMAICGFYLQGNGPSFFQRMLSNGKNYNNNDLGIESFVVGTWAGGKDDKLQNGRSRLDWEFYQASQPSLVLKIKGMMGCKDKEMCSGMAPLNESVGHFRLSREAIQRYGAREIACDFPGISSAPC